MRDGLWRWTVPSGVLSSIAVGCAGAGACLDGGGDEPDSSFALGSDGAADGVLRVAVSASQTTVCAGQCATLSGAGRRSPPAVRVRLGRQRGLGRRPGHRLPKVTTTYTATATDDSGN